jgi:photosystem II stability/assembly factor-like uncharacterized protein
MKKSILYSFLLFVLLINNSNQKIFSQWVQQYTGLVSGDHLLDVSFINKNTGWACGSGGKIIKTTNAGTNWILQNTGITNKELVGIHAVDSEYVYCVGFFQTILKTTNGGTNWTVIRNGPWGQGASFEGLYFLNHNTGWMLRNEYVIRTNDGCSSFDSTHINFSYLRDIYFKDALTGVMCSDGAGVFKSIDGGVTWNQISIPQTTTETPDFFKESFIGNTGWVIGRATNTPGLGPNVWRTTNFGSNWDTIGRVPYPYTLENYCVFFSCLNTGWCGGSNGWMLKSTNGGINWIQQNVTGGFKRSIFMYSDSIGWVVGASGLVLYTTTSGQYMGVKKVSGEVPLSYQLFQNYPNPFNSQTNIEFEIAVSDKYALSVYEILGRKIEVLFSEYKKPGRYEINYNAGNLSSGIYFYTLSSSKEILTNKFILIK